MARHTAAHYFLEGLCEIGIEYLFCNLGTDHVSIIEEMARWDRGNRRYPKAILCPHENVAVHMAGGYAADVEATVTIHASTIREAARHTRPRAQTAAL